MAREWYLVTNGRARQGHTYLADSPEQAARQHFARRDFKLHTAMSNTVTVYPLAASYEFRPIISNPEVVGVEEQP